MYVLKWYQWSILFEFQGEKLWISPNNNIILSIELFQGNTEKYVPSDILMRRLNSSLITSVWASLAMESLTTVRQQMMMIIGILIVKWER